MMSFSEYLVILLAQVAPMLLCQMASSTQCDMEFLPQPSGVDQLKTLVLVIQMTCYHYFCFESRLILSFEFQLALANVDEVFLFFFFFFTCSWDISFAYPMGHLCLYIRWDLLQLSTPVGHLFMYQQNNCLVHRMGRLCCTSMGHLNTIVNGMGWLG